MIRYVLPEPFEAVGWFGKKGGNTMRDRVIGSLLVVGLLAIAVPLLAHHGNAAYADNRY